MLEAILGPLAAPQPRTEHGSDIRTSDQRRADALVEVCRRAAAAGGAAPATAKAAVVVTMGYQDLRERTGAGTTLTGELLAPETVRRMACDAAIIPAVLGSKVRCWTWAGPSGWPPQSRCRRCGSATRGAPSPAARGRPPGASHTTSGTGATAARATCRTWPCSARGTTRSCTRGLHRHRHRDRGDLAPVAAPPRDPPHAAGRTGTRASGQGAGGRSRSLSRRSLVRGGHQTRAHDSAALIGPERAQPRPARQPRAGDLRLRDARRHRGRRDGREGDSLGMTVDFRQSRRRGRADRLGSTRPLTPGATSC